MEINKKKLEQLKKDHNFLIIANIPEEASGHFFNITKTDKCYIRYYNGSFDGWANMEFFNSGKREFTKYTIIDFEVLLQSDGNIFKNSRRSFKRL